METIRRFSFATLVIVVILSLNGCAGMSARDRNTAIGVGAVGGAALTGGSALGTVGGAAVGGVVGHEVGKGKK